MAGVGRGGVTEAVTRFEALATTSVLPASSFEVDMSRLPKDEIDLASAGLLSTTVRLLSTTVGAVEWVWVQDLVRSHPTNMSMYEGSLEDNERVNQPGHIGLRSKSKEAVVCEYQSLPEAAQSDSETEVSVRGAAPVQRPEVEVRELVGGGRLRIVRLGPTKAYLLETGGKVMYTEVGPKGALVLTNGNAPN